MSVSPINVFGGGQSAAPLRSPASQDTNTFSRQTTEQSRQSIEAKPDPQAQARPVTQPSDAEKTKLSVNAYAVKEQLAAPQPAPAEDNPASSEAASNGLGSENSVASISARPDVADTTNATEKAEADAAAKDRIATKQAEEAYADTRAMNAAAQQSSDVYKAA